MRVGMVVRAALVGLCLVGLAHGAIYEELVDANSVLHQPQYDLNGGHVIDGDTAYVVARGIESDITPQFESAIRRIDNISGSPSTTTLVTNSEYISYTGNANTIQVGNRMGIVGGQLQLADWIMDEIYRVDTTTGAMNTLVSNADFMAHTGEADARLIDAVAFNDVTGDMAVYDQDSDSVLVVDTAGNITTLIDETAFLDLYGASEINYVSGGMTYDPCGNLYWTISGSQWPTGGKGSIFMRTPAGEMSEVLTQADILVVTGSYLVRYVAYNDLCYAPDDYLYFFDRSSDQIVRFDPAREYGDPNFPAKGLEVFVSKDELIAGPLGTYYVSQFDEYEGTALTWATGLTRDNPGIFYRELLPEDCNEVQRFGYGLELDWTMDCIVSLPEYGMLAEAWMSGAGADLDGDGQTNLIDLLVFAGDWLRCNVPGDAICEENWLIP